MQTIYHKANTRGKADHGWLKSHHSFSFASFQDPQKMGFGQLRVLNDDIVKPKMGFGTHPHRNMEIISIPLSGALSHKDSMDNKRAITVGEVQVMSAGTGLQHSEFNDSKTDEVNFLQLWIQPQELEVTPRYEQKQFDESKRENQFQTVVASKDNVIDDALWIHQDAYISLGNFDASQTVNFKLNDASHGIYVFLLEGEITIGNETLSQKDAVGIWETENVDISIKEDSKILVVEVPLN
ncbi:quercetin 2,3-dioxygenase [Kordia sp. SMS9]|uniref:pirin family protein n=1 Tax=Kordia sp. SMS9 TaxID=2282170 RepID=UPI000E0D0735|nr:pirin family protein [Kordia sp. SMS9]AXG71866.1 quercetin 2,3-dioxygenase [Kordia sp. SMS9]